jgi:hypothetical protein
MLCVKVKALPSLSVDFISVFSARIKVKPAQIVTVNFIITKAGRFVLTKPAIKGLSSIVPKYRVPITVVKQSKEPIKIRSKLEMFFVLSKIRISPLTFEKGGV